MLVHPFILRERAKRLEDHRPKIYVAGSIRGGREFIENYRRLIEAVDAREDCIALAEMSVVGRAKKLRDDAAIYRRDRAWLEAANAMLAEVSAPSLGVGYEIAYALHVRKIPVLALQHLSLGALSAMIGGNDSPLLQLRSYGSCEELLQLAGEFIARLSARG